MEIENLHTSKPTATSKKPSLHKERNQELWDASKGFEAMFTKMMFGAMRKTVSYSEFTKPSPGREMFMEMLDSEYSKETAGSTRGGLAELIYRFLERTNQDEIPKVPSMPLSSGAGMSKYSSLGMLKRKAYQDSPVKINKKELDSLVLEASQKHGVSQSLIKSVIHHESNGNPRAVSKAGAKGLMQLMSGTADSLGVRDSFNPRENVMGGTKYLKQLLKRYQGNEELALAAYNAGPSRVDKYQGVPPFVETQNYVKNVMAYKNKIKHGGVDVIQK